MISSENSDNNSTRNGQASEPSVSLVILTYNRGKLVRNLVEETLNIAYDKLEIIVVDNCSVPPARCYLNGLLPKIRIVEMPKNVGVAGRNKGIEESTGEIVITLDDDVRGLDGDGIRRIVEIFDEDRVGAICFKVVDSAERITNWCHHYDVDKCAERSFVTDEITEGAVAFRRSALQKAGLYPGNFFISHEGSDLAYRLMNHGYVAIYSPAIQVVHHHAASGRTSWRRYYFDTRNLIWLAIRNYRLLYGLKRVLIGIGAMFVYSIRDGYLRYWFRGLLDGIAGSGRAFRDRTPPSGSTVAIVREIERNRPGFWRMAKKRVFTKGVRI